MNIIYKIKAYFWWRRNKAELLREPKKDAYYYFKRITKEDIDNFYKNI